MNSLAQIQATLRAALGSEALFTLISTRLTLRTGVDLGSIKPAENGNVELVSKVLGELTALGFTAESLLLVASKRNGGGKR